MKSLIFGFLFLSTSALAGGPFHDADLSTCEGARVARDGYSVICIGVANANAVKNAKVGANTSRLPRHLVSAEDLNLVDDEYGKFLYQYTRTLVNTAGRVVGYLNIEGYMNTESDEKFQLNTRYNLDGEFAYASITRR